MTDHNKDREWAEQPASKGFVLGLFFLMIALWIGQELGIFGAVLRDLKALF